ncbi:uncharacterized protein LOC108733240 isoform X2 [Agrilus planipennis]|uniref:Uncharacterized protein LOC108733240 isoform X2 n=1 Tax=Agrilus planipennis TaxID=224129 RepID=A0A1W4WII9_AGRPL|nr:uncharacterized protein LOC108733240 isoform X2 [Agrilus planipennis]
MVLLFHLISSVIVFSSVSCFSWDYLVGLVKEYENYNRRYHEKNSKLQFGYFLKTPRKLDEDKIEEKALQLISLVASQTINKPTFTSEFAVETDPSLMDISNNKENNLLVGNIVTTANDKLLAENINSIDLDEAQSSVSSSTAQLDNKSSNNKETTAKWLSYIPKNYSTIKGIVQDLPKRTKKQIII